jgi:hypothetical protein
VGNTSFPFASKVFALFCFFLSRGLWTQGLYLEPHHQPSFWDRIGWNYFAGEGLEPWSSWSLSPEWLGVHTGLNFVFSVELHLPKWWA